MDMDRQHNVYCGCKKNQEWSNLRVCRDLFWRPCPQNSASLIMSSFEGQCSSYTSIGRVASSAMSILHHTGSDFTRNAAFKAFTQYDLYAMQKDGLWWVVIGCNMMQYFSMSFGLNLDFCWSETPFSKMLTALNDLQTPWNAQSFLCHHLGEVEKSSTPFATLSSASPLVLQPSWEKNTGEGRVKWVPPQDVQWIKIRTFCVLHGKMEPIETSFATCGSELKEFVLLWTWWWNSYVQKAHWTAAKCGLRSHGAGDIILDLSLEGLVGKLRPLKAGRDQRWPVGMESMSRKGFNQRWPCKG